jgi:hypothetical protein
MWATHAENGKPYTASEELEGEFIFDDPGSGSVRVPYDALDLPLWWLGVASLLLPAWRFTAFWLRRHHRRRRTHGSFCPSCGYDLRATPDRCPECGRTVVSKTGPASEGKGETEGV